MSTKQAKLDELMRITGKSKMTCDIALQLSGENVDKAIERIKVSYPSMEIQA